LLADCRRRDNLEASEHAAVRRQTTTNGEKIGESKAPVEQIVPRRLVVWGGDRGAG